MEDQFEPYANRPISGGIRFGSGFLLAAICVIVMAQTPTKVDYYRQLKNQPVVASVTAFGATGNGVTDDTTAIRSATTAVCASGGTVYFPPGTFIIAPVIRANPILNICSGITFNIAGTIKVQTSAGSYYSIWGTSGAGISNVTWTGTGTIDQNSASNPLISAGDLHTYPRIIAHTGSGGTNNVFSGLHLTNLRCQWALFFKSSYSKIINNLADNVGGGPVVADSSLFYMDPGSNGGLISGNQISAVVPNTPMAVSAIETHDNVLIENNTIINFSSGIVPAEGATPVSPMVIGNKIKGALSGIRFFSYAAYGATGCSISGGVAKANSIIINQLSYLGSLDAGNGVTFDSASDLCFQDMAINDNIVTYDLSTGAGDDYNVSDAGIGYVQANAGGGCYRCDFSRNTIVNAPVNAVRVTTDGSEISIQNTKATNPGSSLNPGLVSSFRAGIFVSTFSAAIAGQVNVSGSSISDTLATCRFGYGVEMATANTSGLVADGVSVSADDAVCASAVKGVAPNSGTQLPYIRAILNLPSTKVLPGIATATNSTYTSLQEGIVYRWNGFQYTYLAVHNGTPTAFSGCGTSPIITGTDRVGRIQLGTGTVTNCVLSWSTAFSTVNPIVFEELQSGVASPTLSSPTSSTTKFSINGTNLAGNLVVWNVPGDQN